MLRQPPSHKVMTTMVKPLHIGIVGCSAEGAALCYQTICTEGAKLLGPHAHPEVSLHTPSLSDYMACIYRDDWKGFEPSTPCTPCKCATRLRHTPTSLRL
jgi:hypothetical protein